MVGFMFVKENTINTCKSFLNNKIQYNGRDSIWLRKENILAGFLTMLEKWKSHAIFTEACMLIPLLIAIVKFSSGLWRLKNLLSVCNS